MALIGISGKISSGKDTIAKIVQHLMYCDYMKEDFLYEDRPVPYIPNQFQIKKMAGKLKDMVCLLIGCTREQLEDIDFKNKPLGKNWVVCGAYYNNNHESITHLFATYREREIWINNLSDSFDIRKTWEEELTPRKLLQLLGTKCGRNILHPNIWINALFADYNAIDPENSQSMLSAIDYSNCKFPNWIITDIRFENEAQAIKNRNSILIRVNRDQVCSEYGVKDGHKMIPHKNLEHSSETALDDYQEFNYILNNNGTIEELIEKVKEILIKEKII